MFTTNLHLGCLILLLSFSSLDLSYAQTDGETNEYSIERAIEDLGGLSQPRRRARTFLLASGFACLPTLEVAKESSDEEVAHSAREISQYLRDSRELLPLRLPSRLEGTPEEVYFELESLAERSLPRLVIHKEHGVPNRVETFGHSLWTHFNSYCEQLNLQIRVVKSEVCLTGVTSEAEVRQQQRTAVGPLLFVIEQAVEVDPVDQDSPLDLDILVLVERTLVPALRIEPLLVGRFDSTGNFGVHGASNGPLYLRTREVSLYAHSEDRFDYAYRTRTARRTQEDTARDRLNGVLVIQTSYLLREYPKWPLAKLNAGWKRIAQFEVRDLSVK